MRGTVGIVGPVYAIMITLLRFNYLFKTQFFLFGASFSIPLSAIYLTNVENDGVFAPHDILVKPYNYGWFFEW